MCCFWGAANVLSMTLFFLLLLSFFGFREWIWAVCNQYFWLTRWGWIYSLFDWLLSFFFIHMLGGSHKSKYTFLWQVWETIIVLGRTTSRQCLFHLCTQNKEHTNQVAKFVFECLGNWMNSSKWWGCSRNLGWEFNSGLPTHGRIFYDWYWRLSLLLQLWLMSPFLFFVFLCHSQDYFVFLCLNQTILSAIFFNLKFCFSTCL